MKDRLPFLGFLILYLFFACGTYTDYGMTLDEYFVYTRGQYFYTYVRGNDPSIEASFHEKTKVNSNLLFKNSSYPAFLYIFNDAGTGKGGYETYHLLNMIVAAGIFWLMYEFLLAAEVKPWVALLGPVLLFFTPRFLGDIPANPKDMPYAVTYFASLLLMLYNRKMPTWMRVMLIGGAIGATTSIRQVGFLLLPMYGLYRLYEEKWWGSTERLRVFMRETVEIILMGGLTVLIVFATYPYLHADPVNRFIELLAVNKQFPWYSTVLYWGKEHFPPTRPLSYLPMWFLISTPVTILAFATLSLKKARHDKLKVLLLLSIAVNFAMYVLLKPVVYDGMRHFLFLLPHIVLLATLGIISTLQQKKWHRLVITVLTAHILFTGYQYYTLHPYEYTYFNEAVGGLPGVQNDFERDYWGASDKEAMLWLNAYLADKKITKAKVASCSRSASLGYYMPDHIDVNQDIPSAEYFVCYGRFNSLKELDGEVIHTVKRQGVTLNTVVKMNK